MLPIRDTQPPAFVHSSPVKLPQRATLEHATFDARAAIDYTAHMNGYGLYDVNLGIYVRRLTEQECIDRKRKHYGTR